MKAGQIVEKTVDGPYVAAGSRGVIIAAINQFVTRIKWNDSDSHIFSTDNTHFKLITEEVTVSTGKGTPAELAELLATVNAARGAIIKLKKVYAGQVMYNSDKFKGGAEHVCENFSRLHEFELVTRKKVRVIAPFRVGTLEVRVDAENVAIGEARFQIEDVITDLGALLNGEASETELGTATRTGIAIEGTKITWVDAERMLNTLRG